MKRTPGVLVDIRDLAIRRKLITALDQIAEDAYNLDRPVAATAAESLASIAGLVKEARDCNSPLAPAIAMFLLSIERIFAEQP